MNKKEIAELRRRFKPDKANIGRVYGCFVNGKGEVVSYLDESVALLPQEEAEQYLALLKKVLSGTPGRNLIDIVFSNEQVLDSEEHRLLSALRDDMPEARQRFYKAVIDSLDLEGSSYLILCANDAYDVPFRGVDDLDRAARHYDADRSDQVYRYFICAVCPVKDGKPALGYFAGENEFHTSLARQVVGAPELGFLFPAFDARTANIYNALFYSRKPEELHQDFIDGVFRTEPPLSAAEQKEGFEAALSEALDCRLDLLRAVQDELKERVDAHNEAKEEEPLSLSAGDLAAILMENGATEKEAAAFRELFTRRFGTAALSPENLLDLRRFEVKAGDVTVHASQEQSWQVQTREIDGRKYILIPTDGGAELNGFAVKI